MRFSGKTSTRVSYYSNLVYDRLTGCTPRRPQGYPSPKLVPLHVADIGDGVAPLHFVCVPYAAFDVAVAESSSKTQRMELKDMGRASISLCGKEMCTLRRKGKMADRARSRRSKVSWVSGE